MPELLNLKNITMPSVKKYEITSFAGIDLSSAPADIDKKRSPDAPNMMPDSKGNPIKRTGFFLLKNYGGRINGAFVFKEKMLIHAGDSLFLDGEKIWEGMANEISSAQIIGEKLYIFDGFEALVFDGNDVHPLSDEAYIPTVLISKNADECERETLLFGNGTSTRFILEHEPKEVISLTVGKMSTDYRIENGILIFETAPKDGEEIILRAKYQNEPGGKLKEEFNLISRRWRESFYCDTGTEKDFCLSKNELAEGTVRAWVMDEHGEFVEKIEAEDFFVDREKGKIHFYEPITKTPVEGEDNLVIEAEKYFEGYENKINLCKRSVAFDMGGTSKRIFVCGNKEEPGRDFWCAPGDPSYWPDNYYSELCGAGGEILGYSVMENLIATYISGSGDGRSVVIREPETDEDGNTWFHIKTHLLGEEAKAPHGFVFMDKEQLFVTKNGVYAITSEDLSGRRYTQNRSYFINKVFCNEELEKAFCIKWKHFYAISVGGKIYLLDTSQKSYQNGEPLSTFQYECYLWTGIDARILFEKDGKLCFGDERGNVFAFCDNKGYAACYEDRLPEGKRAVKAYWTFPDFYGSSFWKNKTIKTFAIELAPYAQNKVRLEVKINGFWKVLKEWTDKISYFKWDSLSWSNFSWSGNSEPRTVTLKTRLKNFDKAGFRIICDEMDKAFGLYGISLEYTENGRFKK